MKSEELRVKSENKKDAGKRRTRRHGENEEWRMKS